MPERRAAARNEPPAQGGRRRSVATGAASKKAASPPKKNRRRRGAPAAASETAKAPRSVSRNSGVSGLVAAATAGRGRAARSAGRHADVVGDAPQRPAVGVLEQERLDDGPDVRRVAGVARRDDASFFSRSTSRPLSLVNSAARRRARPAASAATARPRGVRRRRR